MEQELETRQQPSTISKPSDQEVKAAVDGLYLGMPNLIKKQNKDNVRKLIEVLVKANSWKNLQNAIDKHYQSITSTTPENSWETCSNGSVGFYPKTLFNYIRWACEYEAWECFEKLCYILKNPDYKQRESAQVWSKEIVDGQLQGLLCYTMLHKKGRYFDSLFSQFSERIISESLLKKPDFCKSLEAWLTESKENIDPASREFKLFEKAGSIKPDSYKVLAFSAVRNGAVNLLGYLLKNGKIALTVIENAKEKNTLLHVSVSTGNFSITKLLVEWPASHEKVSEQSVSLLEIRNAAQDCPYHLPMSREIRDYLDSVRNISQAAKVAELAQRNQALEQKVKVLEAQLARKGVRTNKWAERDRQRHAVSEEEPPKEEAKDSETHKIEYN